MNWLTDLIKHVSISKIVAFAFFSASSFLLFGSLLFPGLFDPIEGFARQALWFLLVYSIAILAVPLVHELYRMAGGAIQGCLKHWRGRTLTKEESDFLRWASRKGNDPVNLRIEMHKMEGLNQLRVMELARSLDRKGMMAISPWDDTILLWTEKGRLRALSLAEEDA